MSDHSPILETKQEPLLSQDELKFLSEYIKTYRNEIIEASVNLDQDPRFIKLRRFRERDQKSTTYQIITNDRPILQRFKNSVEFLVTYEGKEPKIKVVAIGGKKSVLGQGGYGKVKEGELYDLEDPSKPIEKIARKRLIIPEGTQPKIIRAQIKKFLREVQFQGDINAFIAKTMRSQSRGFDTNDKSTTLCLYIPKNPGTNLEDFYNANKDKLEFDEKLNISIGILEDLKARFHDKGIIHRDIKLENVLYAKNLKPKLIDVGVAINLNKAKQRKLKKFLTDMRNNQTILVGNAEERVVIQKASFGNYYSRNIFKILGENPSPHIHENDYLYYSPSVQGKIVGTYKSMMPEILKNGQKYRKSYNDYMAGRIYITDIIEPIGQSIPLYSFKSDIGALGLILAHDLKLTDFSSKVFKEAVPEYLRIATQKLLADMTLPNPVKRPNTENLLNRFYAIRRLRELEQGLPLTKIPDQHQKATDLYIGHLSTERIHQVLKQDIMTITKLNQESAKLIKQYNKVNPLELEKVLNTFLLKIQSLVDHWAYNSANGYLMTIYEQEKKRQEREHIAPDTNMIENLELYSKLKMELQALRIAIDSRITQIKMEEQIRIEREIARQTNSSIGSTNITAGSSKETPKIIFSKEKNGAQLQSKENANANIPKKPGPTG